jgi:outer membrane murein-binding lipoprotein Lpp
MIDFNASQLTWIVIGACSMGGTGYLTMDSKMKELDTKVEVTSVKMDSIKTDVTELRKQLTRIEDKLDTKQGSK